MVRRGFLLDDDGGTVLDPVALTRELVALETTTNFSRRC
jgi:hypothetical protein